VNDVGRRPGPGWSLERINNDGNYEPGNVVWATKKKQARNRRSSRWIRVGDIIGLLVEWAEVCRLSSSLIVHRLKAGWTPEEALLTPVGQPKGSFNGTN